MPIEENQENAIPLTYECQISYGAPDSENIARAKWYIIKDGQRTESFNQPPILYPQDKIKFTFKSRVGATQPAILEAAGIFFGYKGKRTDIPKEAFVPDANPLVLSSENKELETTVNYSPDTDGDKWGITAAFVVNFNDAPGIKPGAHFYYLPDPEPIVKPRSSTDPS